MLCFDEMKLKSSLEYDGSRDLIEGLQDLGSSYAKQNLVADHALVFFVRGLVTPWKQPFAYYLTHSTVKKEVLSDLLKEVLDSIMGLGLEPKALVCDQGSNNRSCLQGEFGVNVDNPYLKYKDATVICFYDSPHLLKNVRNNLKDSGYTKHGHLIDWEHIYQLYMQDCKLAIRQAPRLKKKHFDLPGFTRMNVRLAAQVLSHSVAKGICFLSSFGVLPSSAELTAQFCDIFDSLFNVFNSRRIKSSAKFNSGLTADSEHWQFLDQTEQYIKKLRPRKLLVQPCLTGWLENIRALRMH